tara:strand:- start:246 stop:584 length:339 start_codon:yes stop_codon:yes gene_type:complete
MSSMSLAIVFLISSMITCFFFTLGRWVGKTENQKQKQEKNSKYKNFKNEGCTVIEAEYEDVIDLDAHRNRKNLFNCYKTIECEWMYLKKENMYVKVPRDIADLINKMNKEKN